MRGLFVIYLVVISSSLCSFSEEEELGGTFIGKREVDVVFRISQLSNSNNEVGIAIGRISLLVVVCCLCVGWVCFFSCCIEVFFWKRSKLLRVEELVQRFISSFL